MKKIKEWVLLILFKQPILMMHGVLRLNNNCKQLMILIIRELIGLEQLRMLKKNNRRRKRNKGEPQNHFPKG